MAYYCNVDGHSEDVTDAVIRAMDPDNGTVRPLGVARTVTVVCSKGHQIRFVVNPDAEP